MWKILCNVSFVIFSILTLTMSDIAQNPTHPGKFSILLVTAKTKILTMRIYQFTLSLDLERRGSREEIYNGLLLET